jgi:hypothetical protein
MVLRRAAVLQCAATLVLVIGCSKRQPTDAEPKRDLPALPPVPSGAHVVPSASVDPKVIAKMTGDADAAPKRLEQTIEMVRLVYGDLHGKDTRSLTFKTEALSTDDMKAVLPLVDSYNGFVGAKVSEAIERLRGEISNYEFGREGSPVIYVHLPYWTSQQEKNAASKGYLRRELTAAEHKALSEKVRAVFKSVDADEIDTVSYSDHVIRVWWD